jgi:Transposase and inactivated derivatives, IS1 family
MFLPKPYSTGYGCATLLWDYAKTHGEKPEPGSAVRGELDEFWHFIESKKKLWIWKAYECLWHAGYRHRARLMDWKEAVNGYATLRYRQTLRKLLDRLAQWRVTVSCTDHWEAYASELEEHPEVHHVETKTETRNAQPYGCATLRYQIIVIGLRDFVVSLWLCLPSSGLMEPLIQ